MTYLKVADHFEVAFSGRRRIRPSPTPPSPENPNADMSSDYLEPDEIIASGKNRSVHTQDGPDAELARVAEEYDRWADDNNVPSSPFVERKPDEE